MERILVVDDDRTTLQLIRHQLKSAGYAVETAGDGEAALARIRRRRFDLVLLDVWMPGMDGLAMLARLRDEPVPPKVVVMTADDAPETLLKAIRERAYHYMKKPVEPEALKTLVASVLASPSEVPPLEVISAKPDWVELLVPCDRDAAERIQEFVSRLETDLPEEVRANVGQAFRELLMNAIEWGGSSIRTRRSASPACALGACSCSASPIPERASASRSFPTPRSTTPRTRPSSTRSCARRRGYVPAASASS